MDLETFIGHLAWNRRTWFGKKASPERRVRIAEISDFDEAALVAELEDVEAECRQIDDESNRAEWYFRQRLYDAMHDIDEYVDDEDVERLPQQQFQQRLMKRLAPSQLEELKQWLLEQVEANKRRGERLVGLCRDTGAQESGGSPAG
jgi:hypothetical protein